MTSRKPIVYIAGPMTGLKDDNLASFHFAEEALLAYGCEVRNPARLGVWANYEHYMEVDLVMLAQCDRVFFLPGAGRSPGAQREAAEATRLGIAALADVVCAPVWDELVSMYEEAARS